MPTLPEGCIISHQVIDSSNVRVASHDTDAGVVRPLGAEDLPAVARLRRQLFRHSERVGEGALLAYLERCFLDGLWRDDATPSLVFESATGEVRGFLGVMARRLCHAGRELRVAVATQLMVAPGTRGTTGRRLARAFIDGPQDMSLSDTANDAARRIWTSVGGETALMLSFTWTKRLRRWGEGSVARAYSVVRGALRSPHDVEAPVGDSPGANVLPTPPQHAEWSYRALTEMAWRAAAASVLPSWAVYPRYDAQTLSRLRAGAAEKQQFGTMRGAVVCTRDGAPCGWFSYYLDTAGRAEVLQLAATPAWRRSTLDALWLHARAAGASLVTGRVEPWLVAECAEAGCTFAREGPWVLWHARRPEVLQALNRGDGFLSRLDGEWWLSF